MEVAFISDAEVELNHLETRERVAMLNVVEKLEQLGDRLPYPHSSAVKNANLRELRPRAGRSRWRAFYRRVGDLLIIGAIGPEAKVDSRAFARAVLMAQQRISEFERQETEEE